MKRKLALILVLCFSLGIMLTGCGSEPANDGSKAPTDTSWEEIKEKGCFVVGLDDAFPPMGFRDENNEIVGFDIDLAREAAKRMGVEVEFQPVIWDTITEELNSGEIDVIWNGLTITAERQKAIDFSEPYIQDKQIIVVKNGSNIKTKADLAGKKVGIQAGSSAVDAVMADKEAYESFKDTMVEFETNDLALMDLKGGGLDAVVVDEVVGRYYIAKHPSDYEVIEDNFGMEEFGVGFRKSDDTFRAELQKTLNEMKADGTSAKISEKWFGEDIIK